MKQVASETETRNDVNGVVADSSSQLKFCNAIIHNAGTKHILSKNSSTLSQLRAHLSYHAADAEGRCLILQTVRRATSRHGTFIAMGNHLHR